MPEVVEYSIFSFYKKIILTFDKDLKRYLQVAKYSIQKNSTVIEKIVITV